MANRHKGEIAFSASGQDYVLSFSANALCDLETALDKTIDDILEMMVKPKAIRLSTLRIMFWQALLDHHEGMTLDETKRILRDVRPVDMGRLVGEALAAALPESGDADPPKPDQQPGTGPASSTHGPIPEGPKTSSGG